ncbi:transposase, partial [Neisseria meningitidis]|uniref:transposase n=1 Tax=Neisseria meningitidis TaxID=487 RepID=UPI001F324E54
VAHGNLSCRKGRMLPHTGLFLLGKVALQMRIRHGMKAIIPKRKNAKKPNPDFDSYLYKLRHLVENAFARLKQFRSIATRYEKLARNFKSMLYLACSIIHAKLN